MPTRLAKRLCPELQVIRGDMENYSGFSNLVTEIIRSEVPAFEKSSIDEFYIDMTGMDKFFGTGKINLRRLRVFCSENSPRISACRYWRNIRSMTRSMK